MAKWYGKIGYVKTVETAPGVWVPETTELLYFGEVVKQSYRWQTSKSTNDDLLTNNQISIVADQFAYDNSQYIKYAEFMGNNWKVTTIEPQYPRLVLTLGGVYNGEQA